MLGVSSRGVSQYSSGEPHLAYFHRRYHPIDKNRGALVLPPFSGTIDGWLSHQYYSDGFFIAYGDLRIPAMAINGDELWGSGGMVDRIEDARVYAQEELGFANGAIHLFGMSMGTIASMSYAMQYPQYVASMTCAMPIPDIRDVHANDRGSFAASIATAYGGAPPVDENPADNPSAFRNIPMQLVYSSTDHIGLPAITEDFAEDVGSNCTLTALGAVGHTMIFLDNRAPAYYAMNQTILPLDLTPSY